MNIRIRRFYFSILSHQSPAATSEQEYSPSVPQVVSSSSYPVTVTVNTPKQPSALPAAALPVPDGETVTGLQLPSVSPPVLEAAALTPPPHLKHLKY